MKKGKNLFYLLSLTCVLTGCEVAELDSAKTTDIQGDNAILRKELIQAFNSNMSLHVERCNDRATANAREFQKRIRDLLKNANSTIRINKNKKVVEFLLVA